LKTKFLRIIVGGGGGYKKDFLQKIDWGNCSILEVCGYS
jgi:hypothetical protein